MDKLKYYAHAMTVDPETNKPMPKTEMSGSKATKAVVITVGTDISPTNGITTNTDVDASVIFADDTVATTVKLIAGVVYPCSIKRVVSGSGIRGLY